MRTYTLKQLQAKNITRYKFGTSSLNNLLNINADLVDIVFEVSKNIDLTIVQGYRSPQEQNALFKEGRSTKDGFVKLSNHQSGHAVDILPRPQGINMYDNSADNPTRWAYFTGYIQATALMMGHNTRTGWKWRINPMDALQRPMKENTLPDANHIEIITQGD